LAVSALFLLGAETENKSETKNDKERLNLPIAKVNDETMTLKYLESITEKQNMMQRKELESEEKRLELLNRLVDLELLAEEAERRGYRKDKEVASVINNQLASIMHKQIADSIKEEEPDDAALKKYYEENRSSYHKPEKVRARHILIEDKKEAEKLLAKILKEKMSQHDFRRLAQERSMDESTKSRGGDLAFFTKIEEREEGDPEIDPEIVKAAFKISNNAEVYPKLIQTDKGYHIIMRTGHRDKMDLSFEDSKDRLKVLVKREMRKNQIENAIDALKEKFKVEIFEENLKHVVIDLSGGPPEPDLEKKGRSFKAQDFGRPRPGVLDRPKGVPKPK
jgi:peptidyl-prolyl cis-trans isomerase C